MNSNTHLHRQVHPHWIENNEVSAQAFEGITSQVFTPTPKDQNQLSVANGEKLTAQQSYEEHVKQGLTSTGVVSVSGSECDSQNLPYIEDNSPYNGHSYIDYSGCTSGKDIKRKAKILKAYAMKRGWMYRP